MTKVTLWLRDSTVWLQEPCSQSPCWKLPTQALGVLWINELVRAWDPGVWGLPPGSKWDPGIFQFFYAPQWWQTANLIHMQMKEAFFGLRISHSRTTQARALPQSYSTQGKFGLHSVSGCRFICRSRWGRHMYFVSFLCGGRLWSQMRTVRRKCETERCPKGTRRKGHLNSASQNQRLWWRGPYELLENFMWFLTSWLLFFFPSVIF